MEKKRGEGGSSQIYDEHKSSVPRPVIIINAGI
jgi:hypothetical protein